MKIVLADIEQGALDKAAQELKDAGAGEATMTQQSSRPPDLEAEADLIRATERERLRALREADMIVARQLHADDFQLINPSGHSLSKEQYLGRIAAGDIVYLLWEPETIAVRLYGQGAVIRYEAQLQIALQGQKQPLRRLWHTDSYEQRDGHWQAVWSQATEIR